MSTVPIRPGGPVERRAVLGLEDDQGRALGRLGEVLVEQLHGAGALAAGRREVVGEGAATAGGQEEHGPRTRTQAAMVRQGCLALAIAMPRVNLSMVLPFVAWVSLMDGS